jgi:glycosyltransferase involved in cell wall biosynthesis
MPDGMLRFAMVTTFYPPYHFGGDALAVRRLAHALARRGHRVDVIHDIDAYFLKAGVGEPAHLREPANVRVHGLRSAVGFLSCLATHQFGRPVVHGRRIRRILDQGFDVIHYHNISLVGGPGILAFGDAIKLYTAHEHWLVCPAHVLWRHNREVCTGRECLKCVLHHRRPPQPWRSTTLLRDQTAHVDAFLTLSDFCATKHAEFDFHLPMTVIPPFLPGVEEIDGDAGATALPDDFATVPYFLSVGRLEVIKGLQDVIPHFGSEAPAELWIAGAGSYEPTLRKLAAGRRVRFLGVMDAARLQTLYRHAIAVVMPSVCYEVFPMVVLEAFREGTPIVARRLGPFPEIIERSDGGLLFSTQDELRTAFTSLATNRALRDGLGERGQRAFRTHWDESVSLDRYFEVIREVAERRNDRTLLEKLNGPRVLA